MAEPAEGLPPSSVWKDDLLASIVVFLVALPLCMGIAIASGAPIALGLISGIVGGLLVGALAGCQLQVTGPAAGLAVIVYEIIQQLGLEGLGLVVLVCGVLQTVAGLARLGQWFRAVSPAVIKGMLAGIGFLILASQFHVMLDDKPKGSGVRNLEAIPDGIMKCFAPVPIDEGAPHHFAAGALGCTTILVILLWSELAPRRLKVVPAALVAVVLVTGLAYLLGSPVARVDVPANLWNDVHLPTWDRLAHAPWGTVLTKGLLLAVIASAETLLSAAAVDQMHQGRRTNYDRELFAQGIGNTLCGLLGSLPLTGVIVRSSANVLAGGKTRMSTILHGLWILIFVVALAPLLRLIPTCSLAAILVYTGFKLADVKSMRELKSYGWSEVAIYLATVGAIVFANLLTGVLVGIGLSLLKLLYTFSHLRMVLTSKPNEPNAQVLELMGAATFVRLPQLAAQLDRVSPGVNLHVGFAHLTYIDHACLDLLMTWSSRHQASGGSLTLDWDSLHARFRRETPAEPVAPTQTAPAASSPV